MLKLIWLIPILPLLGVVLNGLFGRRMSRSAVGLIGCGVVAASLGKDLFTRFYFPFEAISLLLIVAMIGAVLLAKRKVS